MRVNHLNFGGFPCINVVINQGEKRRKLADVSFDTRWDAVPRQHLLPHFFVAMSTAMFTSALKAKQFVIENGQLIHRRSGLKAKMPDGDWELSGHYSTEAPQLL